MDKRIITYFAGKMTQTERINLLEDIKNNESLRKEYAEYQNIEGLVSLSSHPDDAKNGKNNLKHFLDKKKRKRERKIFIGFTRYAAIILFFVTGSWIVSYHYYNYNEPAYNEVSVPAGQYSIIKLSDGTEVWMNARSSLRYPSRFDQKERKVELKGEAYFHVTSQKKIPFIVSTPQLNVKVLGTSFNVRESEGTAIDVSLLQGSVEVTLNDNTTSKSIRLKPMQSLKYTQGNARVIQFHNENDFLWRQGILFFDKLSLSEIAKKIEWHYDTHIIINDPEIGKHIYSGKFRQQDGPHEILRILQKSQKFSFKKDDVNNTFILDKY